MRFGSGEATLKRMRSTTACRRGVIRHISNCSCGQMTVELAVTIPVIMAIVAIVVNMMMYLSLTARFDRLAAEAVRIEAVSPSYGSYGTQARVDKVRVFLQEQFSEEANFVRIEVQAYAGSSPAGSAEGEATFSLIPQLETYECTLCYSPWGFQDGFFGVRFFEMSHARNYTIDPFRPAVIA